MAQYPPPRPSTDDPAVTVCFMVELDHPEKLQLGTFTQCDGLSCEVTVEQREEGGNNLFVHQLPGRIKYSNIKLTRPVNDHSKHVAQWISGMAHKVVRSTASITAMTADGVKVASWSLTGVIPVKWTGPQLSVDSPKVATETLELAHHGFIGRPGAGG
jgi:phage tail-like protein